MQALATFSKKEHLCGEIRIGRLFAEGKAFIAYPLRVVYSVHGATDNIQVKVLVNVPKKRFKRAVKRNRLKRLMREAYRLNKSGITEFCLAKNIQLQIAFNYVSDQEMDFKEIESKMIQALQKIQTKLNTISMTVPENNTQKEL